MSELWGMFENLFTEPGERHTPDGAIPSMGINTMGEVLDGLWYVNRHERNRMTPEELMRGSGDDDPPSAEQSWEVLTVKRYDARPGLLVADADNTMYLLRFDPPGRMELSTGASMVASRIFHALGYFVPQNYVVEFDRSRLVASPEGADINAVGAAQKLMEDDIDLFLRHAPTNSSGLFRAVATKVPAGDLLGPYSFYGVRSDDPNDINPHEHRRDLRGLRVISAWLGYNWIRPLATMDFLEEVNGVKVIRHYIVDFFSALGSGFQAVKHAREGHETWFEWDQAVKNFFGFGIYAPKWQRASYPGIRSVGRFEYETFAPEDWMANTHLTPLANHLPDDDYWAARKVMAFSDDDIRALVKVGRYSDPRAEDWLVECLIKRRDKIGKTYFSKVLPIDQFRIQDGKLTFADLGVYYGFFPRVDYAVTWTKFDNFSQQHTPIENETTLRIPGVVAQAKSGSYFAARLSGGEYGMNVDVFLRKEAAGPSVVGVDRHWPGKRMGDRRDVQLKFRSRYEDLKEQRKRLFDDFTKQYNKKTGFDLEPEQYFESLSVSERTTFDAVTHALMNTQLTNEDGNSLGGALELLDGVERIAGQYYGRQGDEQFRVYVRLRPDAREIVEKSQQFYRSHDNTVYHVGYPINFRQFGKEPTLQISMAEDGLRADIDVDYRSSKMPSAMWNGHLTSANSDVRAGNNHDRHNNRWSGLIAWWKKLFGEFTEAEAPDPDELMARVPPPKIVNPLPPNRPPGTPIREVADAAQEFLADWLVYRNFDEAMEFISDETLPCLALDPARSVKKATRSAMREVLETSAARAGRHASLSTIIESSNSWGPNIRPVEHRFSSDFALVEASDSIAESFLCTNRTGKFQRTGTTTEPKFGAYYATLLRFRIPTAREGVLALLWKKENGQWRMVSYDLLTQ